MLKILSRFFKNCDIEQIKQDFLALKTENHVFKTEVLTDILEKMDKLSKKLELRIKREKIKKDKEDLEDQENENHISKVLLPSDDGIFKQT